MCFIKVVVKICLSPRPKMPFGGDISLTYVCYMNGNLGLGVVCVCVCVCGGGGAGGA